MLPSNFGGVKKLKKLFLFAHLVTTSPVCLFRFRTDLSVTFFPLFQWILQPRQAMISGPSNARGSAGRGSHLLEGVEFVMVN